MAWLTGKQIQQEVAAERILIQPFDENQCNPNSYDYRLGENLKILKTNSIHFDGTECIDPRLPSKFEEICIPEAGFLLEPHKAYIGYTQEKFGSDYYASMVTGKSSIGRLFINNHKCAGLIDQGFYGHITLEITVSLPVLVFPNMKFGQIFFFETTGECNLYRGRYQEHENKGLTSQLYLDWR